jgi:hypothetical protein
LLLLLQLLLEVLELQGLTLLERVELRPHSEEGLLDKALVGGRGGGGRRGVRLGYSC